LKVLVMMSSFASNAILAKSAAMYGRMLTGQDYTDLLNCRSVSEVAAYLKTRTSYADIFEGVSTITIHRGRLEELLKKRLFMQYASLCRYEMSIGQDFYKYFIIKNDILQILSCVRLLGADRPGDYLFTLPAFFNEHTGLDLIKMATAKSFEDLLDVLEGTPYQKVLAPFRGVSLTSRSNLDIEAALYKYFYYELWALANKAFRGKRLEGVLDVLRIQADMRTLVSLYRLKNMLDAHEVLLRQFTFPGIGNLTDKQLTALVRAPSAKELLKSLEMTRYRNQLEESDYGYVEAATHRILYRWSKKYFRFSTDPTVVMFCYIYLAENEIENITHIVEGIRYDVPPENIKATLIGADSQKSS
jgi:V/A-type H+/Na+-transporting ATPase subunit C